ncbi:HPr kinase/phosphorylase [Sphingomonas hylomeconis]|uniref:HPr kinase/phosphorylase n=1 Tax=Sphingomonas hylomeconis TaxID=1395958 RepID=A0ABV7SV86_9SPHN|nr:hypothetical protein [Sphingomonas hylomeconis]
MTKINAVPDTSRYSISGLTVAADLEIPGAVALTDVWQTADVTIASGALPDRLDGATGGPNWQMTKTAFLIVVPGIIRMLVSNGADIRYALIGDTAIEDAVAFLSGTGFGILLHQRERILLHASAVRVGNRAVLFCGASGAGKSTLAGALVTAGYDLVSDDFCAISIDAKGVSHVAPDGRQLKLWRNAIDRLALEERRRAPVRSMLEKFYVEPRAATACPLQLGAVYMLREQRATLAPGIARPSIVDGTLMVRGNAYRPAIVRRMAQQKLYFDASASICQHAGIYTLTRPMAFHDLPVTIDWLEAHWRDIGLLTRAA